MWIAYAMDRIGDNHDEMWDEADGFFYDVLRLPDGSATRLKVRSMVGPPAALREHDLRGRRHSTRHPRLMELIDLFRERYPEVVAQVAPTGHGLRRASTDGGCCRRCRGTGCGASSRYLLDEDEFLGPYGIRSLSKVHLDHPFEFDVDGQEFSVSYLPAESDTGMFGGNSNWRGPVWMPVNALIVRGLLNLYAFYGDELHGRVPDGLGRPDDAVRGGAGDLAPPRQHLPRGRRRATAGPRRMRDVPGGSALA